MIFRKTEGNEKSLELDKDIVDNENLSTDRRYILLKKHYIGLDVFRMVAVLSIFAFHTNIHLNAKYGILSDFLSMGAVFMTAFFMLSGFSLFANHAKSDLIRKSTLRSFYTKRFIGIIPMYYVCGLIFILTPFDPDPVWKRALIAPVEIFGIQSDFDGLFGHSHNGGTWFISCLVICYLLYPFFQELIKMASVRTRSALSIICGGILLYAPFVQYTFNTGSIYSNPFFRCLEFIIGMLLASFKLDAGEKAKKILYNWWTIFISTVILIAGVTIGVELNIFPGNYMLYSWISLPCFCVILFGISGIEFKHDENILLKYFCNASYAIFLSQLYSNSICKIIISSYGIQSNTIILMLGWSLGLMITLALRFVEKRLTGYLKQRLL